MFKNYVCRKNTNAVKWDDAICDTQSENAIALSVADMDFRTAPEIINRIVDFANHGIYGYSGLSKAYYSAVKQWMYKYHNLQIDEEWIVFSPRVIQALSLLIQNETEKTDQIVIQTPLYDPIQNAIESNGRTLIKSTLRLVGDDVEIDFEDLEGKIAKSKMFIVCSPHNPMGRIWTREEIERIISICKKYEVLIIADEVHADFVWSDNFVSYGEYFDIYENIIICTSPGKTFNIPGIEASNIIIKNKKLRASFKNALDAAGIHNPNYFVTPAIESAYTLGEEWFLQVKNVLFDNKKYARDYINENFEDFKVMKSESTYMLWIDYRDANISEEQLKDIFVNKAKVVVSMGSGFGEEGIGFFRINVALPKFVLEDALQRMNTEISKWRRENEK